MIKRQVIFSPEAENDLVNLYDWISTHANKETAMAYLNRLEEYCKTLAFASERGHLRKDIRPNLRIVGFEKRITIAFQVKDNHVEIYRLFYGGQNWEGLIE